MTLQSKPVASQIDGSSASTRVSLYGQGVLPWGCLAARDAYGNGILR